MNKDAFLHLLTHLPTRIRKKSTSVVVSETNRFFGERPDVSFADLWSYYVSDPTAQNSVNATRDYIVGSGFYVTAQTPRAINIINEFCDGTDLYGILYDWVGESLVCGLSLLEMLTPSNLQDLKRVDMTTIKKIQRDPFGEPMAIIQEVDGTERKLDPANFIPFRLFEVARRPFSIGMLHSLALPQLVDGKVRPSIFDSWNILRDAMIRILDNYSDPKVMYVFENASETFLQDQAEKIKNMEKGEKFLTNKKFEFHELKIDPRTRFDGYVTSIRTEIELGSQTPAAKLQTTTGYTEASARAVIELVERRIMAIQRKLKRIIEKEIFDRILLSSGINPERARVELHWGQPEIPEFELDDVLKAASTIVEGRPLIGWEEARNILKKSGWELTETQEQVEQSTIEITKEELEEELTT